MGKTLYLNQSTLAINIDSIFSFSFKNIIRLNYIFLFSIFMIFSCATKQIVYIPVNKHISDSIRSGEDIRTFTYYAPTSSLDEKSPLLFVLHGGGGSDKGMMYLTRLSDLAEQYGFIVVYAQGYANRWNDGRSLAHSITDQRNTNDIQFLKDLRTHFITKFTIDESKIGVVGLSNGGFMATQLACKTNGEFTHFISIVGGMSEPTFDRCIPNKPQNILLIQGKKDPVIPFSGGQAFTHSNEGRVELGKIIPFHESLKYWSFQNKCTIYKKEKYIDAFSLNTDSNFHFKYLDCDRNTKVEGIAIENGDHSWPHGYFYQSKDKFGYLNEAMDASFKTVKFLYDID